MNEGVKYENTIRSNHMLQKISHRMKTAHKRKLKMGSSEETKTDAEAWYLDSPHKTENFGG
jgi:uncharacterized protein